MGYVFTRSGLDGLLASLAKENLLFAPRRYVGQGEFSDTDSIRYGRVSSVEEMELEAKSQHTFKEALLPISETLFFFTEDSVKEADIRRGQAIVFLRSCDLHAVRRFDEIYLGNGGEDYYYQRLRDQVKFVLLGCPSAYENCFCVDMGTNVSTDYHASLDARDGRYHLDLREESWKPLFDQHAERQTAVTPAHVTETATRVAVPEKLEAGAVARSGLWDEYDTRCIACGRCNFSCPTCTCFTMQDLFYSDNGRAGERRRVWAGCMVDGFTDVAGGGSYRRPYGQRMRFKVLHKVLDYKQRFGYHLCVVSGRSDDVCPSYISFSTALNKLGDVRAVAGAKGC